MLKIIYSFIAIVSTTHFLDARYDSYEVAYKKKLMPYALSDKGDVPSNTDSIKRRIFKMPGDGNCFLWSAGGGMTRRKAVDIWLKYSSNPAIRAMGSNEIFDAFFCDELPAAMKSKTDYNELKALLIDVQSRLDDETTIIGQMATLGVAYSMATRTAIENEQEELFRRIRREYCSKESVYRDFVNLVLSQDSYYLFTTCDSLSDRPLFIDILAYDQNKNLVTYSYGANNKSLVQTHRYVRPGGSSGTWEMVLQGQHYNRVVPVNDARRLEESELDELACLASLILFPADMLPVKVTGTSGELGKQKAKKDQISSKLDKGKPQKTSAQSKKEKKKKKKENSKSKVAESIKQEAPVRIEYVRQKPQSRTVLRSRTIVRTFKDAPAVKESPKRVIQLKKTPIKTTKSLSMAVKKTPKPLRFKMKKPKIKAKIKNKSNSRKVVVLKKRRA